MRNPWRYACRDCGSVALQTRTRKGGYRCNQCGHVMGDTERVDRKAVAEADA